MVGNMMSMMAVAAIFLAGTAHADSVGWTPGADNWQVYVEDIECNLERDATKINGGTAPFIPTPMAADYDASDCWDYCVSEGCNGASFHPWSGECRMHALEAGDVVDSGDDYGAWYTKLLCPGGGCSFCSD